MGATDACALNVEHDAGVVRADFDGWRYTVNGCRRASEVLRNDMHDRTDLIIKSRSAQNIGMGANCDHP